MPHDEASLLRRKYAYRVGTKVFSSDDVPPDDGVDKHLAFMDIDAIWFELQHFKNERSWYNLNLDRDCILRLLSPPNNQWYKLFIPPVELEFTHFEVDPIRWTTSSLTSY